jgi:hypothetical protein
MRTLTFRGFRFAVALVLLLVLVTACSGPEQGTGPISTPAEQSEAATPTIVETDAPVEATPTGGVPADPEPEPTPTEAEQTEEPEPTPTLEPEPTPTESLPEPTATPEPSPTPEPTPTTPVNLQGGLLPDNRIIAFYGHPSTGQMGILGEFSKEDLLQVLMEQVAEYEEADPDTPVIPAFELIATVAQPEPQSDGTYLLYTGDPWIQEYVDFTAENNMLLFLDLQIGHSTIRDQIALVWHFLQYPHVHVALDPEFATGPDYAPGTIIGGVDGNHINIAIEMLSELVIENDLPNKILVVHQFDTQMILNKEVIQPLPGVDFVLHMDGWGTTEAKVANYHHFVRDQLIQFGGFKIFYRQDIPVMTAAEVLEMGPPPPYFISYQ